ncbi:hypothetical protein FKP32DRAFT_467873 [Trametes sanguinea]|nr:hypothetical protein FKP32DRAFT_467873 [Trametes sanguinea]
MARPLPPISLPIQNVAAFPPLDMSGDQPMPMYPRTFPPPRQPASGPVRTVRPSTRQATTPWDNPTGSTDPTRNASQASALASKPLPPIPFPPPQELSTPWPSSSRLHSVPRRMASPPREIDAHFASSSTSHASSSHRAANVPRRFARKRTPALTITPPTPLNHAIIPPEPMFTIPSFRSASPSSSPRTLEPPTPDIPPSPLAFDMPIFLLPPCPPIRRRRTTSTTQSSTDDTASVTSLDFAAAGPSKRTARRRL